MTQTSTLAKTNPHEIIWELLPVDFILPDEPVDNILQPLLAAILREILHIAGLIPPKTLIATNFGLCAKVDGKTVVKAPDWVYVPSVLPSEKIRRSYTPYAEGDLPLIVLEFLSDTEGEEYSTNPNYPYGKWYFYEQILQIPIYGIFEPESGRLEVYRQENGQYQRQDSGENSYYWLEEMGLGLGVWQGEEIEGNGYYLRWWDNQGNLLPLSTEKIAQETQRAEFEKANQEFSEVFA